MTLDSQLWDVAQMRPSLDLRFADTLSTTDVVSGNNLVDFTRASSGTYVGSDGLIKNSVVNLLLRSEEFDSASWVKSAGCSVTPNSEIAPDSTLSASRIDFSGANESMLQSISALNSTAYTISFWVKGTAGETIRIARANMSGSFNHTLNGQWQRVTSAGTSLSTTISVGVSTFSGVTARSVYIWGAQLEQSDTAGEYVKTTSSISGAPRFDHDPETGESLGLLIEEQRTNLLLRSEEFDDAAWTTNAINCSASPAIGIVAPDGTNTTYIVTSTAANGIIRQDATSASATTYTWSCFVKKKTSSEIEIAVVRVGGTAYSANLVYNFDTDTVSLVSDDYGNSPYGRELLPNGWVRLYATVTDQGSNTQARMYLRPSSTGASDMYVWGAQLEEGAFPTSYIPTTSATVTRNADVAQITGTNFSNFYRQDEGTVFADHLSFAVPNINFIGYFNDGTTGNYWDVARYQTVLRAFVNSGGVTQATLNTALTTGARHKTCMAIKADDFAFVADSLPALTDTSALIPVGINSLIIGNDTSASRYLNGTIRRLTYWPARLNNFTLQELTTEQIMAATFNPKGANYTTNIDTLYVSSTGDDTAATYIPYSPGTTLTELSPRAVKVNDQGIEW